MSHSDENTPSDARRTPFGKSPTLSKLEDLPAYFTLDRPSKRDRPPRASNLDASDASNQPSSQQPPLTIFITEPNGDTIAQALDQPLLAQPSIGGALDRKLQFAYNVSWVVNILLFVAKGYAYYISMSKSVLASLVDSLVDLVSQFVIFIAEWQSKKADPRFPVGKARLETIGVLACACIMSVGAYAVIQDSASALYEGWVKDILPDLDAGILMYSVLGAATLLKLICYALCVTLQGKSDSMLALAEDHLNDIVSNVGAAATSAAAAYIQQAWWADPIGGILISLFILWRWYEIAKSQLDKIVGRGAPDDMLHHLKQVVDSHHSSMEVDVLRAYHFGSRFMVEVEVVMPIHYTLKEVHDISLNLQHRLEAIPEVERAFVHVDYEKRYEPEHRTERLLAGLPVVAEEAALLQSP